MAQRAIVTFPEIAAIETIEGLRRRFDPLARVIPAHITLVFPFRDEVDTASLRSHIELALAGVTCFEVGLTEVYAVDDEYLYLDVGTGRERLSDLHARLYTGPLASHLSREHVFAPHMTLGRLASRAALGTALTEARAVTSGTAAIIREVAVFRLDRDDHGEVEFTVALALSR